MKRPGNMVEKIALIFSTGFGLGYCPMAPGTAGSLLGILLGWAISFFDPAISFMLLLFFVVLASLAADITEKAMHYKDPSIVVIDEIVGMAISMWHIKFSWSSAIILFLLFRLFDIWKPFPVKQMEDLFKGGLGIVMDDVMAGIYSNIFWRLGSLFF